MAIGETVVVPSSDGVSVVVHDLGGPSDTATPVLLFSHATGMHGLCWRQMANCLNGDFRCWAVDFRGHGLTELPEGVGLHWSGMGDDLQAVFRSGLISEGAVVHGVGHSMGGAALVLAAVRDDVVFRSLWLYEPIIARPDMMMGSTGENPMAEAARRRRDTFVSLQAAVDNFAAKAPLNELSPESLWDYVEGGFAVQPDGTVTLRCRPSTEAAVFEGAATNGAWDLAGHLTQPTEVACGNREQFGPGLFARLLVDQLAHGQLLERGDLGHFGPLEDPPGMASDLRRWIHSLP